jgi:hypothetical protein
VLAEATDALGRLDSLALEELQRRAEQIQALTITPEISARHRVFSVVVAATGENLRIMQRVSGRASYKPGNPWAR